MITSELTKYIKSQLDKNIPKDLIFSRLSQAGWHRDDIDEGFNAVYKESFSRIPSVNDEFTNAMDFVKEEPKQEQQKEEPEKVENLVSEENKKTESIITNIYGSYKNESENKKAKPVLTDPHKELEPYLVELPQEEELMPKIEKRQPEPIIPKVIQPKEVEQPKPIESPLSIKEEIVQTKETQNSFITHDLIPTTSSNEKSDIDNTMPQDKYKEQSKIQKENYSFNDLPNMKSKQKTDQDIRSSVSMSDVVPKGAMISSYAQDMSSSLNNKREEKDKKVSVVKVKNKIKFWKWILIILVLTFVSGMIFAFLNGRIKIPGLNLSLSIVKKDPKLLLTNMPTVLSTTGFYKFNTDIKLSSPALTDIASGIVSGEFQNGGDKDTISINISGKHDTGLVDDSITFDGFGLSDKINTDIKSDGKNLNITIPSLNQLFGNKAPTPTELYIQSNQLSSIVAEFSTKTQNLIKKLDAYDILSKGVPMYVKNQTSSSFSDFINSLDYKDLGNDNINGIDTYHYEFLVNPDQTKKLLTSLKDLLIVNVSGDEQSNINSIIGASSIDSFEVWVGKNDDNVYRFKFSLKTPLSRILNLNDSGIANSQVTLDWQTDFSDFGMPNNLKLDNGGTNVEDFIKDIRNNKIKNIISNFGSNASVFKNAVGSYGTKSNNGSCTNPTSGSLFSPTGHSKGATEAVGNISESLNSLLSLTSGAGSCYSTGKAWAMSAPMVVTLDPFATDVTYNSFYCSDSTGNTIMLSAPISGTVCK